MPDLTAHQWKVLAAIHQRPAFWSPRRGGGWQQPGNRHRFRKETVEALHQHGLAQRIVIKGASAVVPTPAGREALLQRGAIKPPPAILPARELRSEA